MRINNYHGKNKTNQFSFKHWKNSKIRNNLFLFFSLFFFLSTTICRDRAEFLSAGREGTAYKLAEGVAREYPSIKIQLCVQSAETVVLLIYAAEVQVQTPRSTWLRRWNWTGVDDTLIVVPVGKHPRICSLRRHAFAGIYAG